MIYVDTTALVKLYLREKYSRAVSNWLRERDEGLPLTSLHDLEFTNALNLKQFRKEMSRSDVETVLARFREHERRGVFYRPQINWPDAFTLAVELSRKHTQNTGGARSLEIMHVASALSMRADGFLTFDEKQSSVADAAGLRMEECGKSR